MKKLLLLLFIVISVQGLSQRVKLIEGNVNALKGQSTINLEFTYDGIRVGKFANEKDYLEKKKAEYNEKQPGRGDRWEKEWFSDRRGNYEPRFIDLFAKYGQYNVKEDAPFTIIFNTTFIEPGYNVYVSRKPAFIDGVAVLVSTADKSKVLAKFTIDDAPGRTYGGNDYDTGLRIQEAYATAGKGLGRFILKSVGK